MTKPQWLKNLKTQHTFTDEFVLFYVLFLMVCLILISFGQTHIFAGLIAALGLTTRLRMKWIA